MLFQQINENDNLASPRPAHNRLYFLLFGLLTLWLCDVFCVADTAEHEMQKQDPVVQRKNEDSLGRLNQDSKLVVHLKTITLPAVPVMPTTAPFEPFGQANEVLNLVQVRSADVAAHRSENTVPLANASVQTTNAEVDNIINQLTDLNSQHIQFLLPATNLAKERFLEHMYQCENMQFGALTSKPPLQLILLSDMRTPIPEFRASKLLRLAHDYLNDYERSLLTLYGQGNRPVRIFPRSLDINLATHIAAVLGDKKLQSFSARYFLQGKQVGLTDVVLNEQVIFKNWTISSKVCD